MRPHFIAFLPLLLTSCMHVQEELSHYVLPPEWEAQEAVWFSFSGSAADTVLDKVVLAMPEGTMVVCAAENDSLGTTIRSRWDRLGMLPSRYRIEVLQDSLPSPVVRDAGPIFLRSRDGGLAVLDPGWNYYGDRRNVFGAPDAFHAYEDSFPTMLARRLGLPVVQSPLVIEGGACEINGKGDLLQVEAVTLQRNPDWSRDSIEGELQRVLGAGRIIWLKQGPVDDMWYLKPHIHGDVYNQGTGGHVDEFCRFVNDSTVLLAWPEDDELTDSIALLTRQRMEVNEAILKGAGLHVERVPAPVPEFRTHRVDSSRTYDRLVLLSGQTGLAQGDAIRYIPAASYLNFLITNGRVFAPAYWHEGLPVSMKVKDERMRAVLQKHFPDRQVVQMDPRAINWHGGGVHCWTQQQPYAGH